MALGGLDTRQYNIRKRLDGQVPAEESPDGRTVAVRLCPYGGHWVRYHQHVFTLISSVIGYLWRGPRRRASTTACLSFSGPAHESSASANDCRKASISVEKIPSLGTLIEIW